MSHRAVLLVALVGAAVTVPYFATKKRDPTPDRSGFWGSLWTDRNEDPAPAATLSPLPPVGGPYGRPGPAVGVPGYGGAYEPTHAYGAHPGQSLAQVIRFDITPAWVMQHWPRVSTHLREDGLSGLRVTMMSGTNLHDLAGSLTYYFNKQRQLQRISFDGNTGDPRHLKAFVAQYYGLQLEPALDGELYARRDQQRISSILLVRLAPVVEASKPLQRYHIEMELNRPDGGMSLSSQFEHVFKQEEDSRSWVPSGRHW